MSTVPKRGIIPEAPAVSPTLHIKAYKDFTGGSEAMLITRLHGPVAIINAYRRAHYERHRLVCAFVEKRLAELEFNEQFIDQMMIGGGELIPNGFRHGFRDTRVSVHCFIHGRHPQRLIQMFVHNFLNPEHEFSAPDPDEVPVMDEHLYAEHGRGFPILLSVSNGFYAIEAENYGFEGLAYFDESQFHG